MSALRVLAPVERLKRPAGVRRGLRIATQSLFLAWFVATLFFMSEWGLEVFPVKWLFELDPLSALTMLLSSWVFKVSFLWALALIAVTVTFGRVFCGWMCPVGSMHHLVGWLTARLRKQPGESANGWRPHFRLKYLLLFAAVAAAAAGTLQSGLLDPISLGFRSFASGIVPALSAAVPGEAFRPRLYQGAWLTAGIFLGLLVANRWIVRWWCRALCPLGALLGLASRAAVFRIHVDPELCTRCGDCASACQGADEPFADHRVSECHVCFNCLPRCEEKAISYRPFAPTAASEGGVDLPRRQVIGTAVAGAALLPLFRGSTGTPGSLGPLAIRPPGALPEVEFTARCIRCGACGNACPTSALQPALWEAGAEGLWTPVLVARRGWCEPSCTLCGEVCPTGAIETLTQETKGWTVPSETPVSIGTAFLDHGRCLPWAMATPCIVCEEVCPTSPKAIWLETLEVADRDGNPVTVGQPHVDPGLCIGCGLCEAKCPVNDEAAIRISRIGETRDPGRSLTLGGRQS